MATRTHPNTLAYARKLTNTLLVVEIGVCSMPDKKISPPNRSFTIKRKIPQNSKRHRKHRAKIISQLVAALSNPCLLLLPHSFPYSLMSCCLGIFSSLCVFFIILTTSPLICSCSPKKTSTQHYTSSHSESPSRFYLT